MLPREVDPLVHNMSHESPGDVKYSEIGGLTEQIRELREVSNMKACDMCIALCVLCLSVCLSVCLSLKAWVYVLL